MEQIMNGDVSNFAVKTLSKMLPEPSWAPSITQEHWRVYERAMDALEEAGVPFLLGGAFGLAGYIQRLRDTKDLDCFILPSARESAIDAITKAGFADYHDTLPYDRSWIFRSTMEHVIVDLIWTTPNHRSIVDPLWFERAPSLSLKGRSLRLIPAEELLWIKLYVLQRDRCDWPDLLNLLDGTGDRLDWDHLVRRLGDDLPLLEGLLHVYSWLCPGKLEQIPESVCARFHLKPQSARGSASETSPRVALLDSRPWFSAQAV